MVIECCFRILLLNISVFISFIFYQIMNHTILSSIGNTPLVKVTKIVPENCADIYVKLEYFNPTGSYKDRMALAMIEGAEKKGLLKKKPVS